MTETEQIAKVCEWLEIQWQDPYETSKEWWSCEGWRRALEKWKRRPAEYSWIKMVWVGDECRVFLFGDENQYGAGTADTPSAAALAALTKAMEKEHESD